VLPPVREAPADKESVRLNATGFQVEVGERLTSTCTPKKWKLTFHFTTSREYTLQDEKKLKFRLKILPKNNIIKKSRCKRKVMCFYYDVKSDKKEVPL
jgi:hypothetical protein